MQPFNVPHYKHIYSAFSLLGYWLVTVVTAAAAHTPTWQTEPAITAYIKA